MTTLGAPAPPVPAAGVPSRVVAAAAVAAFVAAATAGAGVWWWVGDLGARLERRATEALAAGRLEDAAESYARAAEEHAVGSIDRVRALRSAAHLEASAGRIDRALALYERIDGEPGADADTRAAALTARVELLDRFGDASAEVAALSARRLNEFGDGPDVDAVLSRRFKHLMRTGAYDAAVEECDARLRANPPPTRADLLALARLTALYAQENHGAVIAGVRAHLEARPDTRWADDFLLLGGQSLLATGRGRTDEAFFLTWLRTAERPRLVQMYLNLARRRQDEVKPLPDFPAPKALPPVSVPAGHDEGE